MGNILHSDKTCADIALHIASEMKKIICQNIILTKTKISILIDESTTLSKLTTLVVVVRAFIENFPGEPYTFNLDLIELNTSAETITKSLLDCLGGHGFDQIFLNECFIAFACDGASVMIGKDSGVATRLKIQFPKLIIWHCSNHRLELAVGDVVGEVCGINNFKIFMDKLYTLFHQSPKNQNELKKAASSLEVQILKIGRILSVRWVASSKRTVNAVINNFSALCEHFNLASMDSTRDSKERSKYCGLFKMITSIEFVSNLNTMSDALDELGDLSEYLQKRSITLVDADKSIRTTIRVLDSMTTDPGPKLTDALKEIKNKMSYKNVILHSGNVPKINSAQFYKSLANNLKSRMMTSSSSNVSRNEKNRQENEKTFKNLLDNIEKLNPKNWPLSNDGQIENIQFGDCNIRNLCQQFQIDEKSTIQSFRIYKMDLGKKEIPEDLKPLYKSIATIPVSTSECERNFSSMNEIMSPLRTSLNIKTVAALLFIKCVGPPLTKFEPEKYVRSWLLNGRHSADDTTSRKRNQKCDKIYESLWKLL